MSTTPTPTVTETPPATPEVSPSQTPAVTPSLTMTLTPSVTLTKSLTPTPTITRTTTPTTTPTITVTPSPSPNIYVKFKNNGLNNNPDPYTPFADYLAWKPGFPEKISKNKYFFYYDQVSAGSAEYQYVKQRLRFRCFSVVLAPGTPTLVDITERVCDFIAPTDELVGNYYPVQKIGYAEIETHSLPPDVYDLPPITLSLPSYHPDPTVTFDTLSPPTGISLF